MLRKLHGKDDVPKVIADQLEEMLFSTPFSSTVALLIGLLILAPVFWWRSHDVQLTTASGIAIALNLSRVAVVYVFGHRDCGRDCAHSNTYWVLVYAILGCFSLNMAALVARAFFVGEATLIALAVLASSGYVVGAIVRAAAIPRLGIPHLLLLFGPLIGLAACAPDKGYIAVSVVLSLFCAGCVGVSFNLHQRIKAQLVAEYKLSLLARTDYLTELANRARFEEHGAALFHTAAANQSSFTLALIDLDGFKGVNDTHGHAAGDELLKEVSTRIQAVLGGRHLAARLGGDEFAIVFDPDTDLGDATRLGDEIVSILERPFRLGGTNLQISGSVGIAVLECPTDTFASVKERADTALYRAKNAGRNQAQVLIGPSPSIVPEAASVGNSLTQNA